MEWLNLHSSVLDSVEVIGADPTERSTWLMLQRWCIGQENGGRIKGCRSWKDRKWQQLVRVTKKEVAAESDLWEWDGNDLLVAFYPLDKETEVKTNRSNGKRGGRPPKKTQTETDPETEKKPPGFESLNPNETEGLEIAKTEGKGRERKGRELPPNPRPPDSTFRPPTLEEAIEAASQLMIKPGPAEHWWQTREASGWQKANAGGGTMPVRNWRADLATSKSWAQEGAAKSEHANGGAKMKL
jgi:hypothetical protein